MKHLGLLILGLIIQLFYSELHCKINDEIGIEFGYGRTYPINDDFGSYYIPNYKDFTNYLRFGVQYYKPLNESNYYIMTGLCYDYNSEDNTNLTFIRIPLGLEFRTDKKIQFVGGFGFLVSSLISSNGINEYSDFYDTKKRIQLGGFGTLGLKYQISTRYIIGLGYQCNIDFTSLYEENQTSSGGTSYTLKKVKGCDSFIKFSIRYTLPNKSSSEEQMSPKTNFLA